MTTVKFIEEKHQYFSDDKELISVSAFTKKFEMKKNWDKIAEDYVKKMTKQGTPMTKREVQDTWAKKAKLGTEAGTIVHKIKENETLGNGVYNYDKIQLGIKNCPHDGGAKLSLNIKEIENGNIYPELMIYDIELGICGQADEVVVHKNTINILDWKTDKEIKRAAFSSKFVPAEKLIPPLSHLDACNYNIYSIKMSLYMYLLWKANKGRFKPGKLILKWCPIERDEDGIPLLYEGVPKIIKEEWIELPYRKKEVMGMLETLKNQLI